MLLSPVRLGRWAAGWWCGLVLVGCSPALDWRQFQPEESSASAVFPCKPSTDVRMVTLAGARVRMHLVACKAGEVNWALAYADVADPARVSPALQALRESTLGNLQGSASVIGPLRVPGMTPNPQAERVRVQGQLPDGAPTTLEGDFFAHGTRVYQATAMGRTIDAEALATFFEGLKLNS